MKDVPGENVAKVVSYLEGALLLLQNCAAIPMDIMGLLNNVMVSADYNNFTGYITSIYFASKCESLVGGYMEYLDMVETEYRTLHRKSKWMNKDTKPELGFVMSNESEKGGSEYDQ